MMEELKISNHSTLNWLSLKSWDINGYGPYNNKDVIILCSNLFPVFSNHKAQCYELDYFYNTLGLFSFLILKCGNVW